MLLRTALVPQTVVDALRGQKIKRSRGSAEMVSWVRALVGARNQRFVAFGRRQERVGPWQGAGFLCGRGLGA